MEALAKSDARMEARLNEFSKRLDAFENRIGQTHAAASSSSSTQHSEASLQRHIAKMSCASSEALTLAERAKLARDFQRESAPAGASETSGAHSSAPAPSSAVVGQNDDPAHHRPHGPHGRHSTAALAASQRERYLAKFEKEEIFGKSLDEIEQDNLTQSMRLRQKQGHNIGRKCMLMPGSGLRLAWDTVSVLLVFYVSLALPYQVAFLMDYMDSGLSIMDFFIDCFFLADIVVNFRTAILHDGELVSNPYAVAREYMRLWFWLDLISSIPFDWFLGGLDLTTTEYIGVEFATNATTGERMRLELDEGRSSDTVRLAGFVRVFKVVKLLRLLRVVRLFRYVSRWEGTFVVISSTTLRMLKLVVVLLMFSHWNGCVQFMIAALNREEGLFQEDSWVYRAGIYEYEPLLQWSWSFFHAASQLLAISVGVVMPRLAVEIWVYLVSMLTGATLYAVFVATVTAFFADADPSAREYRSKVDMVNQYMRHAQLPHQLRLKLRTYYQLRFPGHRAFDEDKILSELSEPLTHEVRRVKCKGVLTALNILEKDDPAIAFYLCDKLSRVVFVAGDYVIREGQEAAGMYFISSGLVEVISSYGGGEVLTTLGPQSFFGEMALLNPTGETTASVVVRTYLEGYLLGKADYSWLERHHPAFRDYLASAARLRLVRMQERMDAKITDTEKLNALFDVIDPVKRRLVRKHAKAPEAQPSAKSAWYNAASSFGKRGPRSPSAQRSGVSAAASALSSEAPSTPDGGRSVLGRVFAERRPGSTPRRSPAPVRPAATSASSSGGGGGTPPSPSRKATPSAMPSAAAASEGGVSFSQHDSQHQRPPIERPAQRGSPAERKQQDTLVV